MTLGSRRLPRPVSNRCRLVVICLATLAAFGAGATAATDGPACVIMRPAMPLPAGRPVVLEAKVVDSPAERIFYRWHLGGGADRMVTGESFGDAVISSVVTFERGDQVFPVTLTLAGASGRVAGCSASIAVGELPLAAASAAIQEADPPEDPATQDHAVLAFNDLGMHCMDLGSIPFALRPPLNVVHAQVVERAVPPRLVDHTEVELRYSAATNAADPVLSPLTVELDGLPPLTGTQTFTARELLSATGVVVAGGAEIRFASGGEVWLAEGFVVESEATFEIAIDSMLDAPSVNTTSRHDPPGAAADAARIRKSDLWDPVDPSDPLGPTVAEALYGVDPLPDEGLPTVHNPPGQGRRMSGISDPYVDNTPQAFSLYDGATGRFLAEGIPLTPIDDVGRLNPYPLLRIEVVDAASDTVLAAIDAVAPVSAGVDCRDCHRRGGVGADPAARATELPFVDTAIPGDTRSEERAAKQNILLLHDFKWGTSHADGPTVLCASCHESRTLENLFPVLEPAEPPHLSLSNVMHDQHGRFVVDAATEVLIRDAEGEPILRTAPGPGERFLLVSDPTDPAIGMEQNCFSCHPGHSTPYLRGVMADPAGLKCSSCHGTMLSVGGLFAGDFDGTGVPRSREPWRDEPRCESCHLGDAVVPGLADLPATLAFDPADPAAVPTTAANDRFAENRGAGGELVLFKDSAGHGRVACAGCHGSPHAIWPHRDPAANDNVTALQLQGFTGRVTDCVVCHPAGSFASGTLAGPHGLHPVGDPDWIESTGSFHRSFADSSGDDACAPCHGADHLGTRLSRSSADRELWSARGTLEATVSAGQVISCDLCHELSNSF